MKKKLCNVKLEVREIQNRPIYDFVFRGKLFKCTVSNVQFTDKFVLRATR